MKMKAKRVLSFLLVVCMCLSVIVIPARAYQEIKPLPALTGNQGQDAANIAMSQLGYAETDDGGTAFGAWWNTQINWNANYTYEDWCAMFACWCACQAGAGLKVAYNTSSAGVNNLLVFLQNNGTVDTGFTMDPRPGDFIFFSNTKGGKGAHVAVVVGYDPSTKTVTLVGGNQRDMVTMETVTWSSSAMFGSQYVKGIGRPNYAEKDTTTPGKPVISGVQNTYTSGSHTTILWEATENTTHYTITLYKLIDGTYTRYETLFYVDSGYRFTLGDGCYQVVVTASNSNAVTPDGSNWKYTQSDPVRFVVGEHECARGSDVFYEQLHPHYAYGECIYCSTALMYDRIPNYSAACMECNRPETPVLLNMKREYVENEVIVFTWNTTAHTTHNSIYIDRKNEQGEWARYENAHYVESGCTRTLPLGEYRILLQSTNSDFYDAENGSWLYQNGEYVYFDVVTLETQYPEKPTLKNMKSGYLVSEVITFTWDSTERTTHYNMYIDRKDELGEWARCENAFYVESGCTRTLPEGEYRIILQSVNDAYLESNSSNWLHQNGDYVYFSVSAAYGDEIPDTITLSGTVTAYGSSTEPVTLSVYEKASDVVLRTLTVENGSFAVVGLTAGEYRLSFSKQNHVTREYEVILSGGETVVDAKLHLVGDVNGDGRVNTGDVSRIYAHAKKSAMLEGYEFACADINNDGRVNTGDTSKAYAHSKKTALLW